MFKDKIFNLKPNSHKYDKLPQKGQIMTEKKHIENMRNNLKKQIKKKMLK